MPKDFRDARERRLARLIHCAATFDALEARVLLSAAVKQDALTHVTEALRDLYDVYASRGSLPEAAEDDQLSITNGGAVSVTVHADNAAAVAAALTAVVGFRATASLPTFHLIEGLLPIASIKSVAKLVTGVGAYSIEPNHGAIPHTGSVDDQADLVLESNRARLTGPGFYDGTGQRVGVISDSYNSLGGAAAGVASGDLPAAGVTVLQDFAGGTDEGRAMLELIHDIAPGASLSFATAYSSEANFAANIRALANPASYGDGIGANVIVDDVSYFAEPFYQDGIISQAIDDVVTNRGVNYYSAAGNNYGQAYEAVSPTFATGTIGSGSSTYTAKFYDFDPTAAVNTRQTILLPAGGTLRIELQWDDPFYKTQTDASHVDTDLDVYLLDAATGAVLSGSEDDNTQTNTPDEFFSYTNSGSTAQSLQLSIAKYNDATTPTPGRFKYINYGSHITFTTFGNNAPALTSHAAAAGGQGVAAVPYYGQTTVESFSNAGPATILFSPTGDLLGSPVIRNSPQVTGVDGTNTTFFGQDLEGDGRPNFSGTSAAAPHVAAVAALVRQANPTFSPAQVNALLQSTADDIGAAGFDTSTGFGVVNAFDAVYPTIVPASVNFADGFESGALSSAYETRSTNTGRIRVTSTNSPFAGSQQLLLDTSVGYQNSLNEVTLHVDLSGTSTKTLSFQEKEFADDDQAMPATFVNSSDTDGVAFSVDGVNWFRIVSLTGAESTAAFQSKTYDLSALAAAAGVTLSADTRIRFQQFGLFPATNDGIAFDDIAVMQTFTQPTFAFNFDNVNPSSQSLTFAFAQDVLASAGSTIAVTLTNTTTATNVPVVVSYGSATKIATVTYPAFNGGILTDGNYSATITVSDASSNTLVQSTGTFFFVQADANRDRTVDTVDFATLVANFGTGAGKRFSQGDFDYSGTVNSTDFNILVSRYGAAVSPGALPAAALAISPFGDDETIGLLAELA